MCTKISNNNGHEREGKGGGGGGGLPVGDSFEPHSPIAQWVGYYPTPRMRSEGALGLE